MTLIRSAAPLLFGALLSMGACAAALAQEGPSPALDSAFHATTLSLSAYGEVKAQPDMATVTVGVTTDGPTADAALQANRMRMAQTIAALRHSGIADKDIQTSNLNLNAQYAYDSGQPPRLTGYQASNQVSVTVDELSRTGAVIDAVVASGANQVNGVAFGLKDSQGAEDQARLAAVKALQAKAALYAQAAGYRVGRLVNLSEGGGYAPGPEPMAAPRLMSMAKAEPTPVMAGQLTVHIDVNGLYELVR